jgi:hypothetical protein
VPAFLGRLLSAQNQLAGRRAGTWSAERVRAAVGQGLQEGAAETLELLAADGPDEGAAMALVGDVLAEFGRRLAALVDELPPDQVPPDQPEPPGPTA